MRCCFVDVLSRVHVTAPSAIWAIQPQAAVVRFPGVFSPCECVTSWSFSCFPSPRHLSLLAEGQKWAGKEEGMAHKTPQSPSPLKWGCLCLFTPQLFFCSENREMLNYLFILPFFVFLIIIIFYVIVILFSLAESLAWPVPKKVIYRYLSVLILPLFGPPCSFVHWNLSPFIFVPLLHLEKSPTTLYVCLLCFMT